MSRLALALSLLAGCSSSPALSIDGKVGGRTLAAKNAVLLAKSFSFNDFTGTVDVVIISDTADICRELRDNVAIPSSAKLTMAVGSVTADGSIVAPVTGAYRVYQSAASVPQPPFVFSMGVFDASDSGCNSVLGGGRDATGGTIELTSLLPTAGERSTGTLDLSFGSDRLVGHFEATFCDAEIDTAPATCQL
jgi:hypothetical protein